MQTKIMHTKPKKALQRKQLRGHIGCKNTNMVAVVKDRIDDFRGFPKEKGNAQETIGRLDSVLKYVSVESLMSVSSSFAESKALSSILDNIHKDLVKLKNIIVYCERRPILTTYFIPNKQRGKWEGLIESMERDMIALNLCISHATKKNTRDIKEDTTEIKNTTSDTNTAVKQMEAQ